MQNSHAGSAVCRHGNQCLRNTGSGCASRGNMKLWFTIAKKVNSIVLQHLLKHLLLRAKLRWRSLENQLRYMCNKASAAHAPASLIQRRRQRARRSSRFKRRRKHSSAMYFSLYFEYAQSWSCRILRLRMRQ